MSALTATAASAALLICAGVPAARAAQPAPRNAHYIGESRPGTGIAQVTVRKRRVVDVEIAHRFWRCSGPGGRRQEMSWDLEIFSPGKPRLRVGRDGRFAFRHSSNGRATFSRFALTGRFSANGRRVAGSFRWHSRGITQRGAVECRSPLIRYTAWVTAREYAGATSQGVRVHADLKWTFDLMRWMTGRPGPYIEGVFTPIVGLSPPPPPFAVVLAPCSDGSVHEEHITARANPHTGQLSAPTVPPGAGFQYVVTGRVSPLATKGPASVSLAVTFSSSACAGSATFEATELAPLAP